MAKAVGRPREVRITSEGSPKRPQTVRGEKPEGGAKGGRPKAGAAKAGGAKPRGKAVPQAPGDPAHRTATTRAVYLSALGAVLLVAFGSLAVQAAGLIGPEGIYPVQASLESWERTLAQRGLLGGGALADAWARFSRAPTLAWWLPPAWAPSLLCATGLVASALVTARRLVAPALLVAWLSYLSLAVVGRDFLWFQWDALLLEVTLASVLVAPWGWQARYEAPAAGWWLLRWILFRLVFFGGLVKLTSGDPTWRNATALSYHFETQPLPNPLSWYAHQLPGAVHTVGVVATLVIELLLVFGIFLRRRGREIAFGSIVLLMGALAVTGNYGFFQVLTVVLAVTLLDDAHFARLGLRAMPAASLPKWAGRVAGAVAAVPFVWSVATAMPRYFGQPLPEALETVADRVSPFRVVNHYGLFAVMTTTRPIPVMEVRYDDTWTELTWRWQTSDPAARPQQVAPHMPRLDWQLWFAGLRRCEDSPWLTALAVRVLEGSEPVEGLIGDLRLTASPRPPDAVRFALWNYRFAERGEDVWWTRERMGLLCPEITRADIGR